MCPITTDPSTTDPIEAALTPGGEPDRGLLRVAPGRDAEARPAARFLLLGESPKPLWGRPNSQHLAQRLSAEALIQHPDPEAPLPPGVDAVIVRADHFFDRSAVHLLLDERPSVIVVPGERGTLQPVAVYCTGRDTEAWKQRLMGEPLDRSQLPAGCRIIDTSDLPQVYDYELRKQARPFIREVDEASLREIEHRTFDLAYKGVTDVVTKYVYPRPAFHATRLAARLGLRPNTITAASLVLVFVVLGLFATGRFGLGLTLGFAMSFLDTLDGKLARVTQTSSRFGRHFDHMIDMIHPPFWWLAWWWGASGVTHPPGWNEAAAITFFGYIAIRVQEWRFKRRLGVRIHVWRRFDSLFRLITTRRNPNLLILTAALLFADPVAGVFWVAGWMVASFAIHAVRWGQAEIERRRSGQLVSWLEDA